jgi:hypothetical protein
MVGVALVPNMSFRSTIMAALVKKAVAVKDVYITDALYRRALKRH